MRTTQPISPMRTKTWEWEEYKMEIAMLIVGLLLGGCIAAAILCCMQINRICDYESEIQRLREKLNNK